MARSLLSSQLWSIFKVAPTGVRFSSRTSQLSLSGYQQRRNEIFDDVREVKRKAAEGDFEVPKLFLVTRTSETSGIPYWEKDILKLLKLAEDKADKKAGIHRPVGSQRIVPNTPFFCKMLWRVKHLVRVDPITFPDGEPQECQRGTTHLDKRGVFRMVPELQVEPESLLNPPEYEKKKFKGQEIAKVLHAKWNQSL